MTTEPFNSQGITNNLEAQDLESGSTKDILETKNEALDDFKNASINNDFTNVSDDIKETEYNSSEDVKDVDLVLTNSSTPDDEPSSPGQTHYFDTFKIYASLRYSGFTEGQSDVIMRAIRGMLFERLSECKEDSVAKSGIENEAYLFQAACSELKTEVQKMREMQGTDYGSNLARLQRDVEIAQQEMNESMTTLKSVVDLDINDRKNAKKEEESSTLLEIQELNNKIAIEIISDLKSEIEALRWQTTRRGLAAVVFVAFAVLVGIANTKKDDKTQTTSIKRKDEGIEYSVPVLVPLAEDVSFDETIHVPSLQSVLAPDSTKSSPKR
ncbi:uncharacterized protein SAPINGB_P003608 [Magnusiomyces paraingens]|uniref:Uncharacterized protein n=1 Tax=Magnusiomyces paraingens TaxID=2606893 RepID=A0A5E8BVL6_9ASCO|nr:uncharacterized protein SAPINGB_P003608 [Saprochaete ingens]VVT53507.1 unnamed protein product [Saprochaete ingens]